MDHAQSKQVCFVPRQYLEGVIQPPGSKSITNRALICSALAAGRSTLRNMLWSEDTEVMITAWKSLGLLIDIQENEHVCVVEGCAGKLPNPQAEIYVANSGTTIRFLTAALAACEGDFTLDGVPRMRERPIGDLIQALSSMGTKIGSTNEAHPDCPPLKLKAHGLNGGSVSIAGNVSSQFLSGLMMASPLAKSDVTLNIEGNLVSRPYVDMTATVMDSFGVTADAQHEIVKINAPQAYKGCEYWIEPDASAASYYLAAAAITGGKVTIKGLGRSSMQGDVRFADVLGQMGCSIHWEENSVSLTGGKLRGIEVDMGEISDTVQTLAAVALFAEGKTVVTGVEHNRFKETDRIADLARELRKVGAEVNESQDGLVILPGILTPATIQTYNDHRMAMSMSLIGLRQADVWIDNPACTAKTYPHYFEDMQKCFGLELRERHQ